MCVLTYFDSQQDNPEEATADNVFRTGSGRRCCIIFLDLPRQDGWFRGWRRGVFRCRCRVGYPGSNAGKSGHGRRSFRPAYEPEEPRDGEESLQHVIGALLYPWLCRRNVHLCRSEIAQHPLRVFYAYHCPEDLDLDFGTLATWKGLVAMRRRGRLEDISL